MVEGKLSGGEEGMPEVSGKRDMGGGKGGEEVVLGGLNCTFGREGAVVIRVG